ncbi:MAG: bifunctional DNA primase/polymerase [Myxococcota bacterium]
MKLYRYALAGDKTYVDVLATTSDEAELRIWSYPHDWSPDAVESINFEPPAEVLPAPETEHAAREYMTPGRIIRAFSREEATALAHPGANSEELRAALPHTIAVRSAVATAVSMYGSSDEAHAAARDYADRCRRRADVRGSSVIYRLAQPMSWQHASVSFPGAELSDRWELPQTGDVAYYPRGTSDIAREAAEWEAHGYSVMPVRRGQKMPRMRGWTWRPVRGLDLLRTFNGSEPPNVGLLLGDKSRQVIDIDDDVGASDVIDAALRAAGLPATRCHGRPGKQRSHWQYRIEGDSAGKAAQFKVGDGAIELRAANQHSVVAGIHAAGPIAATGGPGTIATADRATIERALAAARIVYQLRESPVWTTEGGRDDAFMALAGALAHSGASQAGACILMRMLYSVSGYDKDAEDADAKVARAYERVAAGEPVKGVPSLIEAGVSREIVEQVFGSPRTAPADKKSGAKKSASTKPPLKDGTLVKSDGRLAIVLGQSDGLTTVQYILSGEIERVEDGAAKPVGGDIEAYRRAPADRYAAIVLDLAAASEEAAGDPDTELEVARKLCSALDRSDVASQLDRAWPPMRVDLDSSAAIARGVVAQYDTECVTAEGRLLTYNDASGIWTPPVRAVAQVVGSADSQWWYVRAPRSGKPVRPFDGGAAVQRQVDQAVTSLTEDTQWTDGAVDGIAFDDGFAVVTADGIELRPHSPDHRERHSVGVAWDLDAEANEWTKHLRKHAGGDEAAAMISELVGLALIGRAADFDTALVLSGPGGTGKSTTIEAISALFPRRRWRASVRSH